MSTATSSTVAQSSSTQTTSSSQSNSDTATLYLFTFLATILILVLLSASLVLRSYVLRRRYRRRFQQALSDPLFADFNRTAFNRPAEFDPLGFRRSARPLGPKPVLWDTWLHPLQQDSWFAFTPVAVHCAPSPPPSTAKLSGTPSNSTPVSSSPPRSSPFPRILFHSPFSLSSRSVSPRKPHSQIGSPDPRSPPPAQISTNSTASSDDDATTLAVCVLVAMPDPSAPVYCRVPDAKGKGVDPLESQAPPQGSDDDPLMPTSPRRSRIPQFSLDEDGLPLLDFGVIEVKTGDWVWKS